MAFAHKLGAWLDRRLARDLYDIHVYYTYLRAVPDSAILEQRILNPSYAKGLKDKPVLTSKDDFLIFLCEQADPLDEREQAGLGIKILSTLRKMRF